MTEQQIELIYSAVKSAGASLPDEYYKQLIDGVTLWCLEYICGHDFLIIVSVLNRRYDVSVPDDSQFESKIGFIYEAAANGICRIPSEYLQPIMHAVTAWCIEQLGSDDKKKRSILKFHEEWIGQT